jgi:Protein of unknown function (DUF3800)
VGELENRPPLSSVVLVPSYVDKTLPLDLFTRRDFSFSDSKTEVMLQVADMLSGSLARVLDPGKRSPEAATILSLLEKRALGWEVWPPEFAPDVELRPRRPIPPRTPLSGHTA